MKTSLTVIAAMLVFVFVGSASAAFLDPSNISGSSREEWYECGLAITMYDNVDLTGDQHIAITYPATFKRMSGSGGNAFSGTPLGTNEGNDAANNTIYTFDQDYSINHMDVWAPGGDAWITPMGPQQVYIEVSTVLSPTTAADWTTVYDATVVGSGDAELTQGPTTAGTYGPTDTINFGSVAARHVSFSTINSRYGGDYASVYTMVAEVQFDVSPVPEPATWCLLVLGGVLCALRRHRR